MYRHPAVLLRMTAVHLTENFRISAEKHISLLRKITALIIAHFTKKDRGSLPLSKFLFRSIQHVFNKNPVAPGWVVYEGMGHCSDEFAILDYWRTAHE